MNQKLPDLICDCCGMTMYSHLCKIACPNCGFRFDCSDLTLNFLDLDESTTALNQNKPTKGFRNQKGPA